MLDLKVGLPNFDEGPSMMRQTQPKPTTQPLNNLSASLPSLDELDF